MKNLFYKVTLILIAVTLLSLNVYSQQVSTFEDLGLSSNSEWHGQDNSGGFVNGGAIFVNNYNSSWDSWAGFSYSTMNDMATAGYGNQFSVYNNSGYDASNTFAVVTTTPEAIVKSKNKYTQMLVKGFYITNTTFTTLSMKLGDQFSKKFGGSDGTDKDSLVVTARGYLNGVLSKDSVNFVLADFRFDNSNDDYIVDTWEWFDLSSLGYVDSLSFTMYSSDNSFGYMNTPAYFAMDNFTVQSTQIKTFAPAAGKQGSTAMYKDSSAFVGWANACTVTRGLQNISNASSSYASSGTENEAVGKAGSGTVSLGDGGSVILTFTSPIVNGPGNDFAVFENGFNINSTTDYLELAFVEVSSDGENFFRFPSVSLTDATTQVGSFGGINPTMIHNLAGKYVANYGTPFDLEELKNTPGLNVNNITHVKIIDAIGTIQDTYASKDVDGNTVNDPWPTEFATGGFDLDAVGVINTTVSAISTQEIDKILTVYPNPVNQGDEIRIEMDAVAASDLKISIYDSNGNLMLASTYGETNGLLSTKQLSNGMYIIKIGEGENQIHRKLVILN